MWRQGERVFGFPSGIWTPRRFANCVQWLDADQGVTLTSGKVSQWSDLSGSGNHATQGTAGVRPLLRHSPKGSNVSLPSNLDYVEIPHDDSLEAGAGSFTFAVWYKPSATTLASSASHCIAQYANTYTDGWLLNQIDDRLFVYVDEAAPLISVDPYFDVADVWYRIVVTANASTGIVTVYKNGVSAGTSGVTSWNITVNENIYLGKAPTVVNGSDGAYCSEFTFCKGTVASLADVEADFIHSAPLPGQTAFYPMHEGTGSSVGNAIGAAGSGTLNASATWAGPILKGQNLIEFTGGNNLTHSLTLQPACTIAFVAVNDVPDNAQYQPIGSWSAGGTHGMYIYAKNPDGGTSPAYQWGAYANANSNSGASLSTFKRCIAVARAYNDIDFRTNGSSATSVTGVSGYNGGAFLGYTGGAQILAGRIAEIICYSRALSVSECSKIESYFASKYGL
jgi:hypothetical protein